MSSLREAMQRVDEPEIDLSAIERVVNGSSGDTIAHGHAVIVMNDDGSGELRERVEAESRAKAEAETQRQRDLDAAMADAVEVVARQRSRLGRRVCSNHDGATVRKLFDLLKAMNGADNGESGFGT